MTGEQSAARAGATAALLSHVPLFSGLSVAELEGLASCSRALHFSRGQTVFFRGDPSTGLYVIARGRVKIALTSAEGKEVVLSLLGPMDFFGDLALLDGEPRSADAIAVEPCELWLLRHNDFERFLETHPSAARKLLAVLSRRLRRNAQLVQDAAFLDVQTRVARMLVEWAEAAGQPTGAGIVIAQRLTQTELAGMVAATRESVNKGLRALEQRGWIRIERGRIVVLNLGALREQIS